MDKNDGIDWLHDKPIERDTPDENWQSVVLQGLCLILVVVAFAAAGLGLIPHD